MLKVFGKNNNNLFRNSSKPTYSMPQSLPFGQPIRKCAPGFDFMAIVTRTNRLYFLSQGKFHRIDSPANIADVATCQNTVAVVTVDGQVMVWDFDEEKLLSGHVNFGQIRVMVEEGEKIEKVEMGGSDIFLLTQLGGVYHFKHNQWYETKSYSNIESVRLSHRIIDIASGPRNNLFLSYEGLVFSSTKEDPLNLSPLNTSHKFIKVATNFYSAGITKKGTLMIWGQSIHGSFVEPTEFSKLTKKFIDVKLDKENGYALADDGEVWVWGANSNGELGLSDYETRVKPFPLITLDSSKTLEVFCGHSYTCCLCQPSEVKLDPYIKVVDRNVSEFSVLKNEISGKKSRPSQFITQGDYTIANSNASFSKKNSLVTSSEITLGVQGSSSVSPRGRDNPKSTKKIENYKKIENLMNPHKSKTKYERHAHDWLISQRTDEESVLSNRQILESEVLQLRDQNCRLKRRVSEQTEIIEDITGKIRLLEEAIDEYERNLTSRDHIVQEYQSKEHEYISHIQDLQNTIDEIVREKEKNNQILVIYEDLKTNFQREREYYTDKIREYEDLLSSQPDRTRLHDPVKKGQNRQLSSNKQNAMPSWSPHSPVNVKPGSPHFRAELFKQKSQSVSAVDNVIHQIEANKNLINKSANKLIALLDTSQ